MDMIKKEKKCDVMWCDDEWDKKMKRKIRTQQLWILDNKRFTEKENYSILS